MNRRPITVRPFTANLVTVNLARWSATHPWRALALWLAFVAAGVAMASAIPGSKMSEEDLRVGQSGEAARIIDNAGLADPPTESVLITARSGDLDRGAAAAVAEEVRRDMGRVDGVTAVGQPLWSEDGSAALVPVELEVLADEADRDTGPLQDVTADVQQAHPDLRIEQVGSASMDAAIWKKVGEDLARAERLSLPITFGILLFAFGALIAAGIPVLLAISAVVITMGLYAPLSYLVPDGGTVANVVLLIGLAVGVDYSLFYLKREREERRRGLGTVDAVEAAAATSGHAVVVSGFAVIVSMAGLYIARDATFASLATGAILVVAVAVLGSLTVLPALLAKVGRWVDRPRVPLLWRVNRRIGPGGISRRVLRPVLVHPGKAFVGSTVVVLALGAPALTMNIEEAGSSTLPRSIPEVRTLDRMQAGFPSEGAGYQVAVETSSADQLAGAAAALEEVQRRAIESGHFVAAQGEAVRTSESGRAAVLTLAGAQGDDNDATEKATDTLRAGVVPELLDPLPDTRWAVGGEGAESVDYVANQRDKLPWVIGSVLGLTLVMILVTFRSVPLAVVTTAFNLASVTASFGVLAVVFQHSWAESLLDFRSSGAVVSWIPLFLFVVLVGLSMDYHVFVLSRIREGVRGGLPHRLAVETGITESAGVVTSAAAVMVSVFAVFATLGMVEMKQMGVGLAVAILVDATIIRVIMLPSLLVLLGRAAWWPARVTPRVVSPAQPDGQARDTALELLELTDVDGDRMQAPVGEELGSPRR